MKLPVLRYPVSFSTPGAALTFDKGLLLELVAALRATARGQLFAVHLADDDALADLKRWCELTGNALLETAPHEGRTVAVVRNGPVEREEERPLGSRVWVYTNFDCNLACDYCCVRSSPKAERAALDPAMVGAILAETAAITPVRDIFLTGGEPFLLESIGDVVAASVNVAPTTILTNGMLFAGRRRGLLEAMPRERVTLQVSVDSPDEALHDAHRGKGTFAKAIAGVEVARALGFRVRLAATVSTDADEAAAHAFFEAQGLAAEDRVVRRVALRGFAEEGMALSRADIVPELTFTARGVYYHPVGATDADFLVSPELHPVKKAFDTIVAMREADLAHEGRLASVFHCA